MRAAHGALAASIDGLDDETARRPSLLPGWTVGHVLAHLARNADGMRGMLDGGGRGEVAAQYPGGAAQREADIAAGAGRPRGRAGRRRRRHGRRRGRPPRMP